MMDEPIMTTYPHDRLSRLARAMCGYSSTGRYGHGTDRSSSEIISEFASVQAG